MVRIQGCPFSSSHRGSVYLMALNCFFRALALGFRPAAYCRFHSSSAQFHTRRAVPQARLKYSACSGVGRRAILWVSCMATITFTGIRLFDERVCLQRFVQLLSVIPQPVQSGREAMHDGHQVLHHLLLRRKSLLIERNDFASVHLGIMLEPLESEAGQPVPVGKNQRLDLAPPDRIGQLQNRLRLKFSPPPTSSTNSTLAKPFATTNSSSTLRWLTISGFCAALDTRQ